jgi:hypothetical protein
MNYTGVARNSKEVSSTPIGSPVGSYIQFGSNIEPAALKNFFALSLDSSHALDVVITTAAIDDGTDQLSTLDRTLDFKKTEQEWYASILRDVNTPKLDPNMTDPQWADSVLFLGDTIKGKDAIIKLTLPAAVGDVDFSLKMVSVVISRG